MENEELKCCAVITIPLSDIEALETADEMYELVGLYIDAAKGALIEAIVQRRPELDQLTDFSTQG